MIGMTIDIFERDGFETDTGRIIAIKNGRYIIRCKERLYCIPTRSVRMSLTTKGNSLELYKILPKTKVHYQEGNAYPACSDRLGPFACTTDDIFKVTCKNCIRTKEFKKACEREE